MTHLIKSKNKMLNRLLARTYVKETYKSCPVCGEKRKNKNSRNKEDLLKGLKEIKMEFHPEDILN